MSKTKVVISVSGGVVNAVCTNRQNLEVYLADFDELEAEPNRDCGVPYPTEPLDAFRSIVRTHMNRYGGLKKLIARIGGREER